LHAKAKAIKFIRKTTLVIATDGE